MTLQSKDEGTVERRLRLGMVGGGRGAFIGAVHRIAARMDDRYELVAGALSSDADRARASAADLHIAPERSYSSYEEMARRESVRADGIDVVAIVTPNHLHFGPAKAFLEAGIHVICDKPLTHRLEDAIELQRIVECTGLVFGVTHTFTGYPMVRQAREMTAAGELGEIRHVQLEFPTDWLTVRTEETGNKQAEWRVDPARSGAAGCTGDIGVHAFNLAEFISGLRIQSVAAELSTSVPGRRLDDNAAMLLRFERGARGVMWASQIAPGNDVGLRIRVYGSKAGLDWVQEEPNAMLFSPFGEPPRLIRRAGAGAGAAAGHASRVPAGHPEGFLEAFGQLYADLAEQILAHKAGRPPNPACTAVPGIADGVRGMRFIAAAVASSRNNAAWTDL